MTTDVNATWGTWRYFKPEDPVGGNGTWYNPMFFVDIAYVNGYTPRSEVAYLRVGRLQWGYFENGSFWGEYVYEKCYWTPAVLEYDLVIKGTEVTLPDHPDQGRPVAAANNTSIYMGDSNPDLVQPNTIDAFSLYLNLFVGVNSSVGIPSNSGPDRAWDLNSVCSAAFHAGQAHALLR